MFHLRRINSRLFRDAYMAEVRSYDMSDGRNMDKILDSIEINIYEECRRNPSFRGRMPNDVAVIVINVINPPNGLMASSSQFCDRSCKLLQKPAFNTEVIEKQVTKVNELLLLT